MPVATSCFASRRDAFCIAVETYNRTGATYTFSFVRDRRSLIFVDTRHRTAVHCRPCRCHATRLTRARLMLAIIVLLLLIGRHRSRRPGANIATGTAPAMFGGKALRVPARPRGSD